MTEKLSIRRHSFPRLPLDGSLDLTYRCNNNCRHCWLRLPTNAAQVNEELSLSEIKSIIDQARALGCQAWRVSGGEPMLHPDFYDILDYITSRSVHYSLNTNGTLITPKIARLLSRHGRKMIALYGATADVHDHITRNPGSFEAAMRGMTYLKEANTSFEVQIIPMRDNYHQLDDMKILAQTLSNYYRLGAVWLYFSAHHSTSRNIEISRQRLDPEEVVQLEEPFPITELMAYPPIKTSVDQSSPCDQMSNDDRLFNTCISGRKSFHIDPYGQMSFCCFIKDLKLRYDLKKGNFEKAWEQFIPSLNDVVRIGQEYNENCGSCDLISDCRWCGVYGFLEHGRYSAKVDYLCEIAKKTHTFKKDWKMNHVRYYQIADITIQLISDISLKKNSFCPAINKFQVDRPGEDMISIHLIPHLPSLSELNIGKEIYRKPPWRIHQQRDSWVYLGISPDNMNNKVTSISIYNYDYTKGMIFNDQLSSDHQDQRSLTTYSSDQVLLASVLANRQACYFHSAGIDICGQGFLFIGHSEAGKSTMLKMLKNYGDILCDDRIIVRRWPKGFFIHGTWHHGELPYVSPNSVPLQAMMFLEKANTNELIRITNKKEQLSYLFSHLIKPLETKDWWNNILDLLESIAANVPMYTLRFDKSGKVIDILKLLY